MAVTAALALGSYLGAAEQPGAAGLIAAAAAAVLAVGIALRLGPVVTCGLGLAGAGYGVSLVGAGLDGAAGLVAGGLVLAAELAFWAVEPGAAVRLGREATGRRAGFVGILALAGGILGALLVAAGSTPLEGDAALGLGGVGAVVVVAAVSVWLIHALRNPVE